MLSVWEGLKDTNVSLVEDLDDLSSLGEDRNTLGDELDPLLLSLLLGGVVLLNSLDESLVTARLSDVLNANVDALAKLLAANDLGDLNTDSGLSHVEHDTGSAVVELVWHTLVDRGISDDVNIIALLEDSQISREIGHPLSSEGLRELISSL